MRFTLVEICIGLEMNGYLPALVRQSVNPDTLGTAPDGASDLSLEPERQRNQLLITALVVSNVLYLAPPSEEINLK